MGWILILHYRLNFLQLPSLGRLVFVCVVTIRPHSVAKKKKNDWKDLLLQA